MSYMDYLTSKKFGNTWAAIEFALANGLHVMRLDEYETIIDFGYVAENARGQRFLLKRVGVGYEFVEIPSDPSK